MHQCAVFHHFTSSQPTSSCVASVGCSQSSTQMPPGPLTTTSAAIFAQLNPPVTIPIDNRCCFTQRFSPMGFIQNAPDSHCYYRNAFLPHSGDRKSTRLNSSHVRISYAVFCLKKKKTTKLHQRNTYIITMVMTIKTALIML